MQTDEIGIAESLFGPDATARALICEADGEAIGYAVYFYNYSTWLGRRASTWKTSTSARKSAVRAPARHC